MQTFFKKYITFCVKKYLPCYSINSCLRKTVHKVLLRNLKCSLNRDKVKKSEICEPHFLEPSKILLFQRFLSRIVDFEMSSRCHLRGQFAALSGPQAKAREIDAGVFTMAAEDYVPVFKRLGITCVIRFNKKCYDRRKFIEKLPKDTIRRVGCSWTSSCVN